VDPALLERAAATQRRFFVTPLRFFADVKVRITMSEAQSTWNRVTLRGQKLVPGGQERGDSLVPAETTRALMTDVERRATHLVGAAGGVDEHSLLLCDRFVASDVKRFLQS
jgi:hypothetical protein